MQWQMTFDDEFSGTSVDTAKWNGGAANLQWCGGKRPGTCPQDYDGLTVSGGILFLQGTITNYSTFTNHRAQMNTGGLTADSAKFSQRYGYFEWRIKLPHDNSGEGDGFWPAVLAFPIGKSRFPGGCQEGNEEVDVAENVLGSTNTRQVHFTVNDYCQNQFTMAIPYPFVGNLSDAFHLYGLLWKNDGSTHGLMQAYFDGMPQGSPYVLDARANLWDAGVYLVNQIIPCPNGNQPFFGGAQCSASTSNRNPMQIDYVRVYSLVPSDGGRKNRK
jgi:Glycosyl hydrolases family 16